MSVSASISSGYNHVSSAAAHTKHAVEGKYDDIKQSSVGSKAHSFAAALKKVANVPVNFVKSHPKLIAGVGIATTAIGGLTANPAAIGIGIALIGVGTLGYMSSRHAESKSLNQTTLEMLLNPNKMAEMKHKGATSFLQKMEEKLHVAQKSQQKASDKADKATAASDKSPDNVNKAKAKASALLLAGNKADEVKLAEKNVALAKVVLASAEADKQKGELKTLLTKYNDLSGSEFSQPDEIDGLQQQIDGVQNNIRLTLEKLGEAKQELASLDVVYDGCNEIVPHFQ